MKIVVTGALGHIGSRLIRELPAMFPEAEMVMLDNLLTQRYCSLFNLPASGQYRFLEDDVLTADLPSIFDGATAVVHLAAITDAANSFQIKEEVEQVNFNGTERVAQACRQVDCALVFPSTTSVYGSQAEEVDEDCPFSDLKPQSPYAEAKLKAERLLQNLGEEKDLKFVICRLGTIFGTSIGMRFHTAVNKFCWQAVMGQPLTVWKTALHQNRPYLDLGDAVDGDDAERVHSTQSTTTRASAAASSADFMIVGATTQRTPSASTSATRSRSASSMTRVAASGA